MHKTSKLKEHTSIPRYGINGIKAEVKRKQFCRREGLEVKQINFTKVT